MSKLKEIRRGIELAYADIELIEGGVNGFWLGFNAPFLFTLRGYAWNRTMSNLRALRKRRGRRWNEAMNVVWRDV